jgi:hypothetical protein
MIYKINKLDINVIYIIFEFLDFSSKIQFRCTSKYMHFSFLQKRTEIHDFYNIDKKYLKLLDDKILLNYPFIKYLDANGHYSRITDKGIKNLNNVTKLNAYNNTKITNINHMNKLIELNASARICRIGNSGIKNLNLEKLDAHDNPLITNVNHM